MEPIGITKITKYKLGGNVEERSHIRLTRTASRMQRLLCFERLVPFYTQVLVNKLNSISCT